MIPDPHRISAMVTSPGGTSYRGKFGCKDAFCTRDLRESDRCYGWHCLCDARSNCQGGCPNVRGGLRCERPGTIEASVIYGTKRLANGMLVPTRDGVPLASAPRNERVSCSFAEDDPTTQAILSERVITGADGLPERRVFCFVPQRRKRYVTWTEPDGTQMGRWNWETAPARLEAAW